MRLFYALLALLSLACTQAQEELSVEFHPWDVVGGSPPVAELGITKIEWVEVDRRLFYSHFKTYVFQSEADIAESIHLFRRITKKSGPGSPRLDAYSEVGHVVLHGQEQETLLPVRYAGQEKWWMFLHIHEGDYFSASAQKGRDEEGLIRAWFQNPAKLAHTQKYPSRWLSVLTVLVILVWVFKVFIRFTTRLIRRVMKRGA